MSSGAATTASPASRRAAAGAPEAPAARAGFVDALRGFALVGICVVNLPFIALPISQPPGPIRGWDALAQVVVSALFEAKFFLLFSVLFGFGFARQLRRIAAGRATSGRGPTGTGRSGTRWDDGSRSWGSRCRSSPRSTDPWPSRRSASAWWPAATTSSTIRGDSPGGSVPSPRRSH